MSPQDERKDPYFSSSFSIKGIEEEESAPLLAAGPSRRRHSTSTIPNLSTTSQLYPEHSFHSSDEDTFIDFIMERVKDTRFAHLLEKIAVDSEPGLTNAQLMLNNHDLKPVEAERRQWGAWNFVGFWVADSFNIVS
jgi:NCS1 family nucleobase:cation symporter-1